MREPDSPTEFRKRTVNAMTIVSLSLSHRNTPADVLEKLAVTSATLGDVLARLHAVSSIDEVVVLSTCNRLEVYAAASGPVERVTWTVAGLRLLGDRFRSARSCRWPASE